MSQVIDRYSHVQFEGAKVAVRARPPAPVRVAPSPSIFARSRRIHPPVISPADRALLDDVFNRLKISGIAYRPSAMGRRIPACLRALHARSPAEAIRRLEQDPSRIEEAVNALLIGVTGFFRDAPVFSFLQQIALPDLLRASPSPRILSVGCSDGVEVFSLVMCLLEQPTPPATFEVRGIDCRRRAIARARAGVYSRSALASVPAAYQERYFDIQARVAQVRDAVRDRAEFQHVDATIHLPQPPYDLIACRNLAIYLEHPAAARLWRRLHNALRPGGLLVTGKAEHPTGGFLRTGPCVFRKVSP